MNRALLRVVLAVVMTAAQLPLIGAAQASAVSEHGAGCCCGPGCQCGDGCGAFGATPKEGSRNHAAAGSPGIGADLGWAGSAAGCGCDDPATRVSQAKFEPADRIGDAPRVVPPSFSAAGANMVSVRTDRLLLAPFPSRAPPSA